MSDPRNMSGKERLLKEYDKLTNDPDINNCFGIDYWDPDAKEPDPFHWQITLIPPIGTDYEGGFFIKLKHYFLLIIQVLPQK